MANLTKPTSIRAIHGDMKSQGLKISKDNLYEWANYACDIFLFRRISSYSRSLQKSESSAAKYYCIDNGLRDAVLLPQSGDDGKKLENTIFLQLYRHRSPIDQIFYYQGRQECDFVIQSGIEVKQLIQVSWSLSDDTTRQREINGLIEASEATGCDDLLIITSEEEDTIVSSDNKTIHVVPAWKWLLDRQ